MNTLVSVASKSCGLRQYAKDHFGEDSKYANIDYKQGDIVNTIITCENGETILLTLDTTLIRPYKTNKFTVRGTKAFIGEERSVVYFDGMPEGVSFNEGDFMAKYNHPIYQRADPNALIGAHGGIDGLTCRGFIESVKAGIQTPIDVYDTALWLSIGPLSEMAISTGQAVEVPDFTRGKWQNPPAPIPSIYCLDDVVDDR